jgi:hypothetical protein
VDISVCESTRIQPDTSANSWDGVFFLDRTRAITKSKFREQKAGALSGIQRRPRRANVDNGIASQNKLGGIRMVLPIKIIGYQDLKYDPMSWKTDTLYGVGLSGFTAP